MQEVNLNCGIISSVFDRGLLSNIVQKLRSFQSNEALGNTCHGVDPRHLGYAWFRKMIMQPIRDIMGTDFELIYGMLLDCRQPFHLHDDIKPIPDPQGRHFASFLIPWSVENDPDRCGLVSTLIFNQTLDGSAEMMPRVFPDISDIFESKISHVDPCYRHRISVKQDCQWTCGDVIWWDSRLAHVSSNFLSHGVGSKQAIVMHTYVL